MGFWKIRNFFTRNWLEGLWLKYSLLVRVWLTNLLMIGSKGGVVPRGELSIIVRGADGQVKQDYGVVSRRAVTDAWVNFLVDQLQAESTVIGDLKYHDCGTGTTGAVAGDTAMETPYGGARAVGTQVEGASANIYKTVGTITFTGSFAITEHGVFTAATGVVLGDRHTFAAINVVSTDSIEFSYEMTYSSGG